MPEQYAPASFFMLRNDCKRIINGIIESKYILFDSIGPLIVSNDLKALFFWAKVIHSDAAAGV